MSVGTRLVYRDREYFTFGDIRTVLIIYSLYFDNGTEQIFHNFIFK